MKNTLLFCLFLTFSSFAYSGIIPDGFLGEWGLGLSCKNSVIIDEDKITDFKQGSINAQITRISVIDSDHIRFSAGRYYQGAYFGGTWDIALKNNTIYVKTKGMSPRSLQYCD